MCSMRCIHDEDTNDQTLYTFVTMTIRQNVYVEQFSIFFFSFNNVPVVGKYVCCSGTSDL